MCGGAEASWGVRHGVEAGGRVVTDAVTMVDVDGTWGAGDGFTKRLQRQSPSIDCTSSQLSEMFLAPCSIDACSSEDTYQRSSLSNSTGRSLVPRSCSSP